MIQRFADWLIYVVSGILLGMVGGIILGRMHLEPLLSDWYVRFRHSRQHSLPSGKPSISVFCSDCHPSCAMHGK